MSPIAGKLPFSLLWRWARLAALGRPSNWQCAGQIGLDISLLAFSTVRNRRTITLKHTHQYTETKGWSPFLSGQQFPETSCVLRNPGSACKVVPAAAWASVLAQGKL